MEVELFGCSFLKSFDEFTTWCVSWINLQIHVAIDATLQDFKIEIYSKKKTINTKNQNNQTILMKLLNKFFIYFFNIFFLLRVE